MEAGKLIPFSAAIVKATPPRNFSQREGAITILCSTCIKLSSPLPFKRCNLQPVLTAARKRLANKGWSLRKKAPITKACFNFDTSAIGIPSQGTIFPSSAKSVCRKRDSIFPEAKPRATFCSRYNSSSVECGLATAAIASAPCSCLIFLKPWATYSNACCHSTSRHCPPCFSIGLVRRWSLFRAS